MKENIVIIDGSSLLYRAFYAIPHLTDAQGHPTNAVYGFLNMLLKLYGELDPQYVAVAFDKGKHTFRNDLFDGYKATPKPAPDDLRPQFALIREVLACLGICVLEQEGYEGDDIIGTLARRTAADGYAVDVVTGDRDALQLVTDDVTVHLTKKGTTNRLAVTPAVMESEYGYTPAQVIDMKALMGDTADNIPGVPGIGEKGAMDLLKTYGSLEGVYMALDEGGEGMTPSVKKKLAAGRESAFLSYRLAKGVTDAPIACGDDFTIKAMDKSGLYRFLDRLGLKSIIKRLY